MFKYPTWWSSKNGTFQMRYSHHEDYYTFTMSDKDTANHNNMFTSKGTSTVYINGMQVFKHVFDKMRMYT